MFFSQDIDTTTPPDGIILKNKLSPDNLSGVEKAAILLIALGTEAASSVLKALSDEEVEKVTIEIARLRNISSEVIEAVLVEYLNLTMAQDYMSQGGVTFARNALQAALGPRRAEEIMRKVDAAMNVSALHLLETVETSQLTDFLQNEHPQTAALILAHLNPRKASEIIVSLETAYQQEVLYRLATMSKTPPELLRDIEEVIRHQIDSVIGKRLSAAGGIEAVAEILNNTSRLEEREILDGIRNRDPDLATAIKGVMFTFEDLIHIDDRDMQRILIEVDQRDLALALKATSPELKEKLLNNVSERAAERIKEEVELIGSTRLSIVDGAQRRIIEIALSLEEQEEIVLADPAQTGKRT